MIIAGPPGIGKTSLWRAVADSKSGDAVVLRTTGIQGTGAGLANIADLLDPVTEAALPLMPAPQASALRTALGHVSPEAPVTDMLLERATVGMIRGLAQEGLVIAVDDEQWLDEDSRRLLETAVVRLADVPIGWLVSVRSEHAIRGLPRMLDHELGPRAVRINLAELDDASMSELIMARFPGRWSPGVLRKIITLAAGNPYAALEVARETGASGERDGTTALVPPSLAAAVHGRLSRLGRELGAVQAAALISAPTRALLRTVLPGRVDEHIDEAVRTGILQASPPDPVLRFSHPLLREAAEGMLTLPQSRELHRLIGEAMDDPLEAAWHLARGAEEPDEELAKRVEAAAIDAALRGAPARAATLVRLAVGLTPDQDSQEGWQRRMLWLATLTASGEFDQVRRNSEDWAARIPVSLRGQLSQLRANVQTDAVEQYELLAAALEAAGGRDPMAAAVAYAQVSVSLGFVLGRLDQARSLAAAAIPHAHATGYPPLVRAVLAANGLLAALAGEPGAGDQLREAVRLPGFADSFFPYWSPETALGLWFKWRGDCGQARDLLQAVLMLAERLGRTGDAFSVRVVLADVEWRAGNWDVAADHAQAAVRWSKESGHGRGGPAGFVRSLVQAGYGDVEGARTLAADGIREAEAQRDWIFAALCRWVLGEVELSVDDPQAALRWLDPVSDMLERTGVGDPGCYPFTADLIEAWAATGHLDAAADRLTWLRDAARRLDHPWARITSGRAEAVLRMAQRHPAKAIDAVARVIPEARELGLPVELGRCLLVLGTAQRKARQRREAAVSLDEAIAVFGHLGAARWRELAQAQRARLTPVADDSLTPTERRIAELATGGHSNAEIAATLFISLKTVEANLTRIYRKLGLRGRVDLTRRGAG